MSDKIVFNGQEYGGVEAMPPDVRKQYEDALRLLADVAPAKLDAGARKVVNVKTTFRTRIVFNGKEYESEDTLPPDARAAYNRTFAKIPMPKAEPLGGPTLQDDDAKAGRYRRIALWAVAAVLIGLWWLLKR